MALNMLRLSVSNICVRSIKGCDNKLLTSTFIQTKRFQHSESGNDSFEQLPEAELDLGLLQSAVKNSGRMQAIKFEKLMQDKAVVDKFRLRLIELLEDTEIKPDSKTKVDDLTNIIMTAAKDVCGTSQYFLYKCNKCHDVFIKEGQLILHQSECTGFLSEEDNFTNH